MRCCGRPDSGWRDASDSSGWFAIPDRRASIACDTARFEQIQSRANDAYDPEPAAFPATLVQVDGSDALHRCGQLMPDLVVREIGGDHETMLVPPYVEELAAMVAAAAEDCFASESARRSV